jgi:hypothetical protein
MQYFSQIRCSQDFLSLKIVLSESAIGDNQVLAQVIAPNYEQCVTWEQSKSAHQ